MVGRECFEDRQRDRLGEHPEQQRRLGGGASLDQIDELAHGQLARFSREMLELPLVLGLLTQQGEDGVDGRLGSGHEAIVSDSGAIVGSAEGRPVT
ncbi:hypothetical protein GCM10009590_24010 [Brachybacterium alimentarium]